MGSAKKSFIYYSALFRAMFLFKLNANLSFFTTLTHILLPAFHSLSIFKLLTGTVFNLLNIWLVEHLNSSSHFPLVIPPTSPNIFIAYSIFYFLPYPCKQSHLGSLQPFNILFLDCQILQPIKCEEREREREREGEK